MKLELPLRLTMQEATTVLGGLRQSIAQAQGAEVRLCASALRELDTAAISVLLQCRRQARERGLSLVLESVPQQLAALMALYGVAELFGLQTAA
ncbi:MAG: STAS domain-containing protein [Burkholderiales bacterium]|nr:STAS domain-containing protein [Burkholderiales bacterium]